jgi:uncharacterized membrane protein SpoIIM required for sporulation
MENNDLTVNDFIRLRQKDWERLETLIKCHNGPNRLTAAEIRELGTLYRAVTSDLAQARRDYPQQTVSVFLNQLLTQVHGTIYQQDTSNFRDLLRYFTHTIPQTFRASGIFTLAAFLMFVVPAVIGGIVAYENPDVATPLGLEYIRDTLANHQIWTDIPIDERPYTSAFIMGNNIRVALWAFGGGVLFGVFSIYLLAFNGVHIGAVFGLAAHYGFGQELLDFVFAHGVIELSIIFMAGGAGLRIGWGLINPGILSRRDALVIAARQAVPIAVLAIPALIVAGAIEGFLSPTNHPFSFKVVVGVGTGAMMYGYLLLAGRGQAQTA